ncbi:MAG: cobaltochelatase subunit CobN [Proteobacteria bacterium]|nr:cobaltochelatase subunit CobN [Pseudomonadota bacterium]
MHLLAAQPGTIADGAEAVDLGQTHADIVFISAADTELSLLADARASLVAAGESPPTLRLANMMQLGHNMSVDLYVDQVIAKSKLVIVRILGGHGYWPYGIEQIAAACRQGGQLLAILPGDDQPDPELIGFGTLDGEAAHRLWQYGLHGGPENAKQLLRYGDALLGGSMDWREPAALVRAGLYWPGITSPAIRDIQDKWVPGRPAAALVFYRALLQAGNLAAVDALMTALAGAGLNALPVFVQSLKDPVSAATVEGIFNNAPPAVILNATGFSVSAPGQVRARSAFDAVSVPVLQVVFSGGNHAGWAGSTRGLSARDIAMNVALPEVDGRIFSRAVSFKGKSRRDDATESDVVTYEPVADRMAFVAKLAANWARLARTPPAERRIALVLANYPNRDSRLGNGVGLDTPAGTVRVLRALTDAGYRVEQMPATGEELIERIKAGPTNDHAGLRDRQISETLSFADYQIWFGSKPEAMRTQVTARWGGPEADPFYQAGELDCGRFAIPAFRAGNIAICLQPARGYNIDPAASYHDPALVPPHGYLAFYCWLEREFGAHAVCHMGKHGNLEWLPGKALALSEDCFPEAALGPMPHLYPFIVNDPGEGTQAKRRAQAVIIDHLTPPLTRAESYGPLKDIEQLVDEYYEAAGVDPRRIKVLSEEILSLCRTTGLDADIGIGGGESETDALAKLDAYLCELKEMQIRDGLHVFGESPVGRLRDDLLVALVRVPRSGAVGADASLHRALSADLGLGFDPLDCDMAAAWTGPKPAALANLADAPWRSAGDTVERLELLAGELVSGRAAADPDWAQAAPVLDWIQTDLRDRVARSGDAEIAGLLTGLDGRFVEPGPSGAPTRGRADVLPTGRNFYSVDTRTVPTPAAWTLGWKSAGLLVERHMQDHGDWPRAMAISAWGTSNMRTGGDDIAQALALMGVRPTWDSASRRVTGFEIMPASMLGRPRVDVTIRVSGFFRDAFPSLIDLLDSAAAAVAALDEPPEINPLAARTRDETAALIAAGVEPALAARRAGYRVFGSKPGAYGAGLQALIDEKGWQNEADLARAYVAWGGYAYGAGAEGKPEHATFERRLGRVEAVIQNQDNREHDILDSDDYYQFEGGLAAAVHAHSGERPKIYHNDHSRPERPVIRTLEDEIGRVVRARVVNPKWIRGVQRHGYKGGFEMAATVDYLFAFAATTGAVKDHHFDLVYEAYLANEDVRGFLEAANPDALRDIAARLKEAQERGLWRSRLNDTRRLLDELTQK